MKNETVEWHVRENDYFATAATVLDLVQQDLSSRRRRGRRLRELLPEALATLQQTRDDLMFLQKHYRIVPRAHSPGRRRGLETPT